MVIPSIKEEGTAGVGGTEGGDEAKGVVPRSPRRKEDGIGRGGSLEDSERKSWRYLPLWKSMVDGSHDRRASQEGRY